jgi:hypothetical protein
MVAQGIDGVLVVNVTGDTGVKQQYAGTVANTTYSGTSSGSAMVVGNSIYGTGVSSGSATTVATPMYRYNRVVAFQARLSDPQTSRKFWVGSGQSQSGGALFVGDSASASNAASTIFNDLQTKGLIGEAGERMVRRRGLVWRGLVWRRPVLFPAQQACTHPIAQLRRRLGWWAASAYP